MYVSARRRLITHNRRYVIATPVVRYQPAKQLTKRWLLMNNRRTVLRDAGFDPTTDVSVKRAHVARREAASSRLPSAVLLLLVFPARLIAPPVLLSALQMADAPAAAAPPKRRKSVPLSPSRRSSTVVTPQPA